MVIDVPLTLSVIADVVTILLFGLGAVGVVWFIQTRRNRARTFKRGHALYLKQHKDLKDAHGILADRESGDLVPPSEKEYLDLIVHSLLLIQAISSLDRAIEMQEDLMAEGLF